jgi:hypothetical protein
MEITISNTSFIQDGYEMPIVGTGQHEVLNLTQEALDFFEGHGSKGILKRMPAMIEEFNCTTGRKVGVFHCTC